jgi:lipid II:glycine glycyltransferase (peptidoglycan interpeptide bridge formation enzyme)
MVKITTRLIDNKVEWKEFLLSRDSETFLQSWNWGETNRLLGKKVIRLGYYIDSKLEGVVQIIKEEALRGPHLVIAGGPVIDWRNKPLINFVIKTIKELAQKEKVWFIRIRPELLDSPESKSLFVKLGFVPAPMHLHAENTWVLDITPDEEILLSGMRKTTRYLIRKSLTMGLTTEETIESTKAKILKKLQDETVARHKFVGFSETLFKAQLKAFGEDGEAKLFICYRGKIPLVAAIIIFYGDYAYYHHSGSTLRFPSIPSSYFLQWQIILRAKELGKKCYNFWGIAPTDNPKHRFAGVTVFKKGFGGERIDWLHAQDLPITKLYWLTHIFESLRRIIRRLD